MYNKYFCLLFLGLIISSSSFSQDVYKRNISADVQNYIFNLTLNDQNNEIRGEALVTVDLENIEDSFALDLIQKSGNFGMELTGVFNGNGKVNYTYANHKIVIQPAQEGTRIRTYRIQYHGIPEKGLVIDKTKYGQRSFFGDNWPNLARYWLPCVDHPSDKASVEFRITAPDYYDVIATGKKIEESNLGNGLKLTRYVEPAPVATKVVTIGVTKFASTFLGKVGDIEVSAWVYPENRLEGFTDFEEATKILNYFINEVGPYSYAKLANMQAKTAWGGLENAGTIAYNEKSITGKKEIQRLMAHEIAHQWFGNSASENSWNHVWLSEGFATYFAILYQESVDGNDIRKKELIQDREEVIAYYKENPSPVVDNSIKDPLKVLNRNTYQKGGWVLNMLRHKLGDEVFWKGIQAYYKSFQNANAMTEDFRKVIEEVSGKDLQGFFEQWLFVKGYPELKWNWKFKNGKLKINIEQVQSHHIFDAPVEFGIVQNGVIRTETVELKEKSTSVEYELESKPEEVLIDPEVWLLFEEK